MRRLLARVCFVALLAAPASAAAQSQAKQTTEAGKP